MPTVATYRCSKCGTEYRPRDAGARRFICCGLPLQRVEQGKNHSFVSRRREQPAYTSLFAAAPSTSAHQPMELIEVIPPRENAADALAVATMLNTFSTGSLFSLEMAGDHQSRRFLVRGTPEGVAHIRRQLQATYDQVSFRNLAAEEDPGRPSNLPTACTQLVLSRPAYLPVRTFENGDFQEADPIKGLLGAFDGLQPDERALTQIILSPAPQQWSRRYEGSARQVEKSLMGEAMSLGMVVRQFVSVSSVMTAVAFGLWAILSFIQKAWLTFFVAGVLFSGAVIGVMWLYSLIREQANVDPKLVQEKIATPAFDASIRLFVVGKTHESANRKLQEIVAAYRRLNLQSGNSFVAQPTEFDPREISQDSVSWLKELTARVTRLSTNELASLWHLPVGLATPMVNRNLTRKILPLPGNVREGVLIGHSNHMGQSVSVHLPLSSLAHHIFMVAKTQKGKSTLMSHLAAAAMDRDTSLIVIDPHGDLARSLLSRVPRHRVGDVLYIDFSDTQQFVGLNLLDVRQGRSSDAIVSNIVHVGELIWSDNWGPRMEDALRMALRTLLVVNKALAEQQREQFTLLDITSLFELPQFRRRLLKDYVRGQDQEIIQWWDGYFETLYDNLRMDVMNPVLTKIHRFSTHTVVRNIIGQSVSTVNFRELLDRRRILLVNTATGVIGPDAGGLLGAVLVDYINFAVREQMAIPNPAQRARVVIVVDEFQSIPGVDYPGLLAELQKMGASFILATQALGQLDAISRELRPAIMSNVETLFVFQTSSDDADILRHELDDEVTGTDIINLSAHSCYVKTQNGRDRLPVMHIETLSPQMGDPAVAEQVVAQMTRYTRSGRVVESARQSFTHQWYRRELNLLQQSAELRNAANDKQSTGKQDHRKPQAEAVQGNQATTNNSSTISPAKANQSNSGDHHESLEDVEEPRHRKKDYGAPRPVNPGWAAIQARAHHKDQPQENPTAVSSAPPVADEKATELENGGQDQTADSASQPDTLQVKVTLVKSTPTASAEEGNASTPKKDTKRINP